MRNLCVRQPLSVLREYRLHPHRLVDAEPDEPAIQQVIVELPHRLRPGSGEYRTPSAKTRRCRLRNRRSSVVGVDSGEPAVEREQHLVDDTTHQAQRMLRRNMVLEIKYTKIRPVSLPLPVGKTAESDLRPLASRPFVAVEKTYDPTKSPKHEHDERHVEDHTEADDSDRPPIRTR